MVLLIKRFLCAPVLECELEHFALYLLLAVGFLRVRGLRVDLFNRRGTFLSRVLGEYGRWERVLNPLHQLIGLDQVSLLDVVPSSA